MAVRRTISPQVTLDVDPGTAQNGMILQSVNEISYYPLLQYLSNRAISVDVARRYLKQLHFKLKADGKTQIALGFRSDSGAYEFRNALIKGCIG